MVPDDSGAIDRDLLSKADALARDLSVRLNCDAVYISLTNAQRVFSFGMSDANAPTLSQRTINAVDTICATMSKNNAPLVLEDVQQVEAMKHRSVVTSGLVLGYMGQSLRDEEGQAIGAICALSTAPRKRLPDEETILITAAAEAEMPLATTGLKLENLSLSNALEDYDGIIGAIARHADAMISIHADDGALIFATNALFGQLSLNALLDHLRKTLARPTSYQRPGRQDSQTPWQMPDNITQWRLRIEHHPVPLTFVKWDRVENTPD